MRTSKKRLSFHQSNLLSVSTSSLCRMKISLSNDVFVTTNLSNFKVFLFLFRSLYCSYMYVHKIIKKCDPKKTIYTENQSLLLKPNWDHLPTKEPSLCSSFNNYHVVSFSLFYLFNYLKLVYRLTW